MTWVRPPPAGAAEDIHREEVTDGIPQVSGLVVRPMAAGLGIGVARSRPPSAPPGARRRPGADDRSGASRRPGLP